jgi:hypothetical protein
LVKNPNPKDNLKGQAWYIHLSEFPDYLEFIYINNEDKEVSLGYVKLNTDNYIINDNLGTYEIAIDFGTSSTAMARKLTNQPMEELFKFDNLGSGAIAYNPEYNPYIDNKKTKIDYLTQYFIPHNSVNINVPFQSLLHDHLGYRNSEAREHILDSTIFFKLSNPGQDNPFSGEIDSNLKWSNENAKNERVKVFFRQIARMVILDSLIKNIDTIRLHLSYPGAKINGSKQCERLIEEFKKTIANDLEPQQNGDTIIQLDPEELPRPITEGLAAAQFFSSQNVTSRCIIDIGAGTIDYFLYNKVIDQGALKIFAIDSSIKFGARDLFVRFLLKDAAINHDNKTKNSLLYKFLASTHVSDGVIPLKDSLESSEYVQSAQTDKLLDKIKQILNQKEDIIRLEIENLLSYPLKDGKQVIGDIIHNSLTVQTTQDDLALKFLTILAFGIAAAVYYSGLMARALNIEDKNIDLKFTGNGAKILNWLKHENDIKKMNDFFKYIYVRAFLSSDFNKQKLNDYNFNWSFSNSPKLEAAYGMLRGTNLEIPKISTVILAGETLKITNKDNTLQELDVTDALSIEILSKKDKNNLTTNVRLEDIQSTEFTSFCTTFNHALVNSYGINPLYLLPLNLSKLDETLDNSDEFGEKLFDFDGEIFKNNRIDSLNSYLKSIVKKDTSAVELKSFFFIEVQVLIEIMLQETFSSANNDD